jgi:hypothetical protein
MRRVSLRYGSRAGWAYLRELRGDDEESVFGTETVSAIALLDRLLVAVPGAAIGPGEAGELCAADRDRLLAAIYRAELGPRITASPRCAACDEPYDLEFELDELVATVDASPGDQRAEAGMVRVDDGVARVPTGLDELEASHADDPGAVLAARCTVSGPIEPERLAAALAEAAPLLDLELDAVCPSCGHAAQLAFDIQDYLLGTLVEERARRAGEVHRLARSYGWSLTEIQSLPRARRKVFVDLAERELGLR